jgi:hypothetical protein
MLVWCTTWSSRMSVMKTSMTKRIGISGWVGCPASRGIYICGVPPCAQKYLWSHYSWLAAEEFDWTSVGIGRNRRRHGVILSRLTFICFLSNYVIKLNFVVLFCRSTKMLVLIWYMFCLISYCMAFKKRVHDWRTRQLPKCVGQLGLLPTQMVKGEDNASFVSAARRK